MARASCSRNITVAAVVAFIVTVVLEGTHGDDLEPVPEALKFLTRFRRPVIIPYRGFLKMNQGSSNRRKPSVATGLNILKQLERPEELGAIRPGGMSLAFPAASWVSKIRHCGAFLRRMCHQARPSY
ncbi:hypothetical protein MRX96_049060 [Rhipicephalus microplus]